MSEKTELCGFLPGLIQGYITFSVSPLESQNNFVISLLNKHESDPLYTKSGRNLVLLTQSQGKVYVRYVMHQGMKSGATVTGIIVRKMLGLFYLSSCFRHSGLCFEVSIQAQNDWNLLSMWLGIGEDLLSDNLKPVTEELWIVLFIEKMLSGYQQVKLLRAENDVVSGKLRSLHYTFPLTLLQAQTPACEKNSFFPKSPEVHLCVEVRSWLGWHSCRFLLRQGVAKKYVCVFRTHPEVLRGQGKGWDGNLTGRWENWCETLRQFPSSQEFLSVGNCSWKETQLWLALSGFSCIRNSAGWSLISDIIDKSVAELDIKLMINFLVALFFPNRYIPYLKVLLSNKFGRAFFPCLTTKKICICLRIY